MAIKLNKDAEQYLLGSIQRFFAEQLDDEIGELKARQVLEFFAKELAPSVYNQAIADAQSHLEEKVADLGSICYANEFDYWQMRTKR